MELGVIIVLGVLSLVLIGVGLFVPSTRVATATGPCGGCEACDDFAPSQLAAYHHVWVPTPPPSTPSIHTTLHGVGMPAQPAERADRPMSRERRVMPMPTEERPTTVSEQPRRRGIWPVPVEDWPTALRRTDEWPTVLRKRGVAPVRIAVSADEAEATVVELVPLGMSPVATSSPPRRFALGTSPPAFARSAAHPHLVARPKRC